MRGGERWGEEGRGGERRGGEEGIRSTCCYFSHLVDRNLCLLNTSSENSEYPPNIKLIKYKTKQNKTKQNQIKRKRKEKEKEKRREERESRRDDTH